MQWSLLKAETKNNRQISQHEEKDSIRKYTNILHFYQKPGICDDHRKELQITSGHLQRYHSYYSRTEEPSSTSSTIDWEPLKPEAATV